MYASIGALAYESVTMRTAVNSHLSVMIGASVALSQSQNRGVSHYLLVWLRHEWKNIYLVNIKI